MSYIEPDGGFSTPQCREHMEFIYFSTRAQPEIAAYRVRDLCALDKCACEINVSQLEAHRKDLAVPWKQAGTVLPPGAR